MGKNSINSLAPEEIMDTPTSTTLKQREEAMATIYRYAKDEEDAKFLVSALGLDRDVKLIPPSKE